MMTTPNIPTMVVFNLSILKLFRNLLTFITQNSLLTHIYGQAVEYDICGCPAIDFRVPILMTGCYVFQSPCT